MENESELIGTYVLFFGTGGMLLLTSAITFFIFLYQRKLIKRKLAFQEIEDLLKKQEIESAYVALNAQDNERKRIAEEVHDNLGSLLVTLNMFTDTLLSKGLNQEQAKIAERITTIVDQASTETRRLAHNLHSGTLKYFGLNKSLEDLLNAVEEARKIETEYHYDISIDLSNDMILNIYRVIQELVNNTLKHANATKVWLEVKEINNEYLNIIYEDNGRGFSEDKTKGIGLKNIYSRVNKLHGKISLDSKKGVSVTIELPYQ